LGKLAGQAASYKRLLLPLDNMKTALGNIFGQLVGIDLVREETTYGTIAQEWEFLTAPDSSSDVNANFLLAHSKADWDVVEKQANDKAAQLRQTLDARKAFHDHFYAAAEQKCSDDRARTAALASFGGMVFAPPISSGSLGAAPDRCQATEQSVALFLSGCMRPQPSACGNFRETASCYSQAASQCGGCGTCSSQFQSAASQARASAQQICAN
jgi:hypothetical protein